MNKYNNRLKRFAKALIIICIIGIISGFFYALCSNDEKSWSETIKDIIVPLFCALVGATIPLALDNSVSNEKFKIVLDRLAWRWKNRYYDEHGKKADGTDTIWYDIEYKFITQNRGKSDKEIKKQMKNDKYWEEKFLIDAKNMNTTEEEALNDRIKDHFIY